MTNFLQYLKYLPILPEAIKEGGLVQAAIANPTSENLNAAVNEADVLCKELFPGVDPARIDAGCAVLLAGVTLEDKHDAAQIAAVLAVVATQLPVALGLPFEITITQKA